MQWYFGEGLKCLFEVSSEDQRCQYAFMYMIGYVISLFMLQLTLTYLMQMKKGRNARMIFALMVPITIAAFLMGAVTYPSMIPVGGLDVYHVVSTHILNSNSTSPFWSLDIIAMFFSWH